MPIDIKQFIFVHNIVLARTTKNELLVFAILWGILLLINIVEKRMVLLFFHMHSLLSTSTPMTIRVTACVYACMRMRGNKFPKVGTDIPRDVCLGTHDSRGNIYHCNNGITGRPILLTGKLVCCFLGTKPLLYWPIDYAWGILGSVRVCVVALTSFYKLLHVTNTSPCIMALHAV